MVVPDKRYMDPQLFQYVSVTLMSFYTHVYYRLLTTIS